VCPASTKQQLSEDPKSEMSLQFTLVNRVSRDQSIFLHCLNVQTVTSDPARLVVMEITIFL
jgi:hypothetical protein